MSKPTTSPAASGSWGPKRHLLLLLAGTLAATFIVVAVSAILSPAAIDFSVVAATPPAYVNLTVAYANKTYGGHAGMYVNLTVAAGNPGWRAGVEYKSFDLALLYSGQGHIEYPRAIPTPQLGRPWVNEVNATSITAQPPRSATNITVPLFVGDDDWAKTMKGKQNHAVQLFLQLWAHVRFTIWVARTRVYKIAVLCELDNTLFNIGLNNTVVKCGASDLIFRAS
uniref:Late embryogenesis abundant protein LEA-2 subgroup domain-containing protein n=1 Tax=Oryza brachyantha TaxID=4533 RepID=J3MAT9_ORYBR